MATKKNTKEDPRREDIRLAGEICALVMGEDSDPKDLYYFHAVAKALILFRERSRTYGRAWRRHGALGNLLKVDIKNSRLMEAFWFNEGEPEHKDAADDALDMINYAAFFYGCKEEGNERGERR